jgi:DDE superfamily endonuclease
LSQLLEGDLSHDQITRFLSGKLQTGADWWLLVKPEVRRMESPEGVVIFDDSIEEKPYTDENDLICWHWDHSKERSVKGINFMTALYSSGEVSLPVSFQLISKTEHYVDAKSGKTKRKSPVTKNEYYRQMLFQCVKNQLPFRYVLNDSWFASKENMKWIKEALNKEFVMPLKLNRKVALSASQKQQGRYQAVQTLALSQNTLLEIYLEGVDFPLTLIKQVFTNEDGSTGILYLVTSDRTLSYDQITALYQKRWKVEVYHKSLKQNASLAKSPTRTVVTQGNHFFAALYAYVKLEVLKIKTSLNHFALKTKIYTSALQSAYQELRKLAELPQVNAVSA